MKIISIDQVEKKKVEMEGAIGAWKQLPLGSKDGVPVYSYRVFSVEPGGNTPYHSHPYEHMNFVIEGEGVIKNAAGEERIIKTPRFQKSCQHNLVSFSFCRFNHSYKIFRAICSSHFWNVPAYFLQHIFMIPDTFC